MGMQKNKKKKKKKKTKEFKIATTDTRKSRVKQQHLFQLLPL